MVCQGAGGAAGLAGAHQPHALGLPAWGRHVTSTFACHWWEMGEWICSFQTLFSSPANHKPLELGAWQHIQAKLSTKTFSGLQLEDYLSTVNYHLYLKTLFCLFCSSSYILAHHSHVCSGQTEMSSNYLGVQYQHGFSTWLLKTLYTYPQSCIFVSLDLINSMCGEVGKVFIISSWSIAWWSVSLGYITHI